MAATSEELRARFNKPQSPEQSPSSNGADSSDHADPVDVHDGLQLHMAPGTQTGYKGVERRGSGVYRAYVFREGKNVELGRFADVLEAATTYANYVASEVRNDAGRKRRSETQVLEQTAGASAVKRARNEGGAVSE